MTMRDLARRAQKTPGETYVVTCNGQTATMTDVRFQNLNGRINRRVVLATYTYEGIERSGVFDGDTQITIGG